MSGYFKGFIVSSALHLAVLGLILAVSNGGLFAGQKALLVDFSSIVIGPPQEGGDMQGDGAPPPKEAAPEDTAPQAPPPELKPKPAPAPPAKPKAPPKPRPAAPDPAPVKEASQDAGSGGSPGSPDARGSGPGSGTGKEQGQAQSYVNANYNYILLHISRNFEYPSQARRMGLNGTATFSFTIQKDGNIHNLLLDKSSGHRILDEAVEKAIMRAAPFPPPPVPARVVIPIRCRLT